MRKKTYKRVITEKEIMSTCITIYGEQMKNNTFTNMYDYSEIVRRTIREKVKFVNRTELSLDSYVTSIILYMFNM